MSDDLRIEWARNLDRFRLTEQEREIVTLLLAGYSTKELCAEMHIEITSYYVAYGRISKKLDLAGKERLAVILRLLGIEGSR